MNFKLYLLGKVGPDTAINYDSCIHIVLNHIPLFNQEEVEKFFLIYQQKGKTGAYLNHIRRAIRQYSIFTGIPVEIPRFKEEESLLTTMADQEIEQFLSLPNTTNTSDERWNMWTMFWTIMAYSGMRPAEVGRLTVNTVDFGLNVYRLHKTKTVPREVPISSIVLPLLTVYIKKLKSEYLFTKIDGGIVTRGLWLDNFNVRIREMGIKRKGLVPYSLRHSLCTRLCDQDLNILRVKQIMGHRNIRTTERYYHASLKGAQLALQQDPLGKKTRPMEFIKEVANYILKKEPNPELFYWEVSDSAVTLRVKNGGSPLPLVPSSSLPYGQLSQG